MNPGKEGRESESDSRSCPRLPAGPCTPPSWPVLRPHPGGCVSRARRCFSWPQKEAVAWACTRVDIQPGCQSQSLRRRLPPALGPPQEPPTWGFPEPLSLPASLRPAAPSPWVLEVPSLKSRRLSLRPWGPDPLCLDLTAQKVGTTLLQRNRPWGLDAEGQIGEGLWGHATGGGQLAAADQSQSWGPVSLGSFLEALRQHWGPYGVSRATGSLVGSSSLAGVSADTGGCLCGVSALWPPCKLCVRASSLEGAGPGTGQRDCPAWPCRAPSHPSLTPGCILAGGRLPRPLPKARCSSGHASPETLPAATALVEVCLPPHGRCPAPSMAHTQLPAAASLHGPHPLSPPRGAPDGPG